MNPSLVSATLSTQDLQDINAAITTLKQKMPFLIDLTAKDRQIMQKRGDRSEAFVRKAVDVAFEHPDQFNPAFLEEMRKDADLFDALLPIRLAIGTLHQKLDDTVMQVGGEGYAAARTVYSATKTSFGQASMRSAADDLAIRFGRS